MRVRDLGHVIVTGLPLSSPGLIDCPFTWPSAFSTCSQSGIGYQIPTGPHWPSGNLCHLRASVSSYVIVLTDLLLKALRKYKTLISSNVNLTIFYRNIKMYTLYALIWSHLLKL